MGVVVLVEDEQNPGYKNINIKTKNICIIKYTIFVVVQCTSSP